MTVIVGFAGSLSTPSRTKALVETASRQSAKLSGSATEVFDLRDLGPKFGMAHRYADLDTKARQVVDRLIAADALVIGSPVFKGSYTGLFKHVFDLLDAEALRGKPVLLTATGGGYRHALIIEHQLRPLFGFFEASVVATGVYASSDEFSEGVPSSPELIGRIDNAAQQLAAAIAGQTIQKSQERVSHAA